MNTSPKSVKLLFLAVLLLTASSSCFSAPPPAQNAGAPTDASPSVSPSPLPSSPPPTSPTLTPQSKEFDQKWQALTDAIKTNLNNESPENFQKVQAAAQELSKVPNLADDLQLYLNDLLQPGGQDDQTFNKVLATKWLPEKCKQNVNSCFQPAKKDATVNGIIEALNQEYNPQSSQSPPSTPLPAQAPTTPTPTHSSSPEGASLSISGLLGFLIGSLGFLIREIVRISLATIWFVVLLRFKGFQKLVRKMIGNDSSASSRNNKSTSKITTIDQRFNPNETKSSTDIQRLDEEVKFVRYEDFQYANQNIEHQVEILKNQVQDINQKISIANYDPRGTIDFRDNSGNLPLAGSQSPMVPSSNPAPATNSHQEQLKRLFSQGIPVEDANMGQRRAGYEDYPVFARSSQGRSRLAVYPNPNTNELCLLPNPNTATYQYLESYFNLEPGSSPNGLLYLIQAAQVIPHGDGWRLAVKGIIRFT